MEWWHWLEANAIYFVIGAALLAGLAASFGCELEAKRRPDRGWWIRRLLIIPILAIIASAATDLFRLSPAQAAFSTAMLSMGGYDVLCLLKRRWLRRLEQAASEAGALLIPDKSR